jgi:hypothetical protein
MGDESWDHHFEPKSQHQRMAPYKKSKEEFKSVLAVGKRMDGIRMVLFS